MTHPVLSPLLALVFCAGTLHVIERAAHGITTCHGVPACPENARQQAATTHDAASARPGNWA